MSFMIIYLMRNNIDGRCYVGQTRMTLRKRMNDHRAKAKNGGSQLISRAIAKHGWDAFEVEVLEECRDDADTDMAERFWIRCYGSLFPGGYNLETGGHLNKTHCAATRLKMSERRIGIVFTPEHLKNMSLCQVGKQHSAETLKKMASTRQGEDNAYARLTWEKVREIRRLYLTGEYSQYKLADMFGTSQPNIGMITMNRKWINDPLDV